MYMYVSMSGLECENLSVDSLSLTHTYTNTQSRAHTSMRPFLWVNIFLPASARCPSAGHSLQKRALSDLEQGAECGQRAYLSNPRQATLSPLSCSA